jgi:crossover junction endodeoxyribonuclease RusA
VVTDPLLSIVVHGTPGTAGSKSGFPIYRGTGPDRHFTGRVAVAEKDRDGTKRNWRAAIVDAARAHLDHAGVGLYPLDEPLVIDMIFTVAKPAAAPKTKRTWPVARPDLLKYARATEDALTAAGVLKDDARVVEYGRLAKVYPREDGDALDTPGVTIRIWRITDLVGWQRDAAVAEPAGTLFDPIPTHEGAT